ncbi:MAG: fumarylacetoacetate hydrolase family protein, partial [Gammaproteobacteria bacterium]|nr:fumarylacetoacetate hydrolase family protein [Gammaproteobacteria bacterium]
ALALGLDFTKRKLQKSLSSNGLPWERSKAFDGSAAFSEFVELNDELNDLSFEFLLNGKSVQKGSVDQMIYKPEFLLKHISEFMTFDDGDILMTGTPKGVGGFTSGDIFEGKVFAKDRQIIECGWRVE